MRKRVYLLLAFATVCAGQQAPSESNTADRRADSPNVTSSRGEGAQGLAIDDIEQSAPAVTLEIGAESAAVDGKKSFGLQAYRDVPQGAIIRRFDYQVHREASPLQFTFTSQDVMQRDMTLNATLESA